MKRESAPKTANLSLFANLSYAFYNGALGFASHSWWYIALCAYYIVLSVMRFALLKIQKNENDALHERFVMRFTGAFFIVLAVVLAGTTYLAFSENKGIRHHEIIMITFALYAFLKVTLGAVNLTKSRNMNVPVLKTLRNVSFADALVSVFSLQRSMLVSFDGMSAGEIALLNAFTGTIVYLAVFLMGLNLIGGKRINMAKTKIVQANKKIAEAVSGGYKKIESGVVTGYTKIEDRFIDNFLKHEGETLEEARERLKGK